MMRRAISLAQNGAGRTNPNPLVGAVIEKDGRILGEGFHRECGSLHAEREALADAASRREDVRGATMYVTLEPCCHFGRQPPCTDAIIGAGIARVVVGSRDPNPAVSGKGAAFLRAHGADVVGDFLRTECDALNPIFFHFITTGTPYVALKYAMTADGKIATRTGDSKWISSDESRAHVQELRNRYAGILAGIGTVLADDPLLTCRMPGGTNPLRIVCDSSLRIPAESAILRTAREIPTLVVGARQSDAEQSRGQDERRRKIESRGAEVWLAPAEPDGTASLSALCRELGARNIDSVLIEGGARIHYSALAAGIVRRIYCYIAPKVFGGAAAKSPVGGIGVERPADGFAFTTAGVRRIGGDVLIEYEPAGGAGSAAEGGTKSGVQ